MIIAITKIQPIKNPLDPSKIDFFNFSSNTSFESYLNDKSHKHEHVCATGSLLAPSIFLMLN